MTMEGVGGRVNFNLSYAVLIAAVDLVHFIMVP